MKTKESSGYLGRVGEMEEFSGDKIVVTVS